MSKLELQDIFLNVIRRNKSKVTLVTTSGHNIIGCIKGFDQNVIILENSNNLNNQILCYKTAVSHILADFLVIT